MQEGRKIDEAPAAQPEAAQQAAYLAPEAGAGGAIPSPGELPEGLPEEAAQEPSGPVIRAKYNKKELAFTEQQAVPLVQKGLKFESFEPSYRKLKRLALAEGAEVPELLDRLLKQSDEAAYQRALRECGGNAQAGANEAALGDMQPNNTSAILALREAATLPLQPVQERFYGFCEEVARVWAEFWVMLYGDRELKIEDESGTWYFPFRAARYRDLLISTRVDVSGSVLWNETQTVQMLDNLLEKGVIDGIQYLERLPKGAVAGREELIRELRARQTGQGANPPETQDGAAAAMPRAQGNG